MFFDTKLWNYMIKDMIELNNERNNVYDEISQYNIII